MLRGVLKGKNLKQPLRKPDQKRSRYQWLSTERDVHTGDDKTMNPPHDHQHVLGTFGAGTSKHIEEAIDAALKARAEWASMPWEHRASIFLKAAELIAGPYRAKINAATMLGQSKNAYQAEIDAACEFIDFLRYNVQYITEIYQQQPESGPGVWNRVEHRPLEGFIFALTPFNFYRDCRKFTFCAGNAR